jgi:phosphatidyl-myo-inositol dimannoside synthase
VVSVSRLVPRKGFDTLIRAAALLRPLRPKLQVAIAGAGRDQRRLETLAQRLAAPVVFLGRVPHEDLPLLYGCGDVFAMLCRNRWGGLEQEGFGIVFLEAAACAVPQLSGISGGAGDAVVDAETGILIDATSDLAGVTTTLDQMLSDSEGRHRMGKAGRARAEAEFSYDLLARRLGDSLGVDW